LPLPPPFRCDGDDDVDAEDAVDVEVDDRVLDDVDVDEEEGDMPVPLLSPSDCGALKLTNELNIFLFLFYCNKNRVVMKTK
jgi:hypothetical protein